MLAEELMQEAKIQADFRNAEVIIMSMGEIQPCPRCLYPENYKEFHERLYKHRQWKLQLHRTRRGRALTRACNPYVRGMDLDESIFYGLSNRAAIGTRNHSHRNLNRYNQTFNPQENHWKVEEFWPCAECIAKYNPTGRVKHNPTNLPTKQGVLDV